MWAPLSPRTKAAARGRGRPHKKGASQPYKIVGGGNLDRTQGFSLALGPEGNLEGETALGGRSLPIPEYQRMIMRKRLEELSPERAEPVVGKEPWQPINRKIRCPGLRQMHNHHPPMNGGTETSHSSLRSKWQKPLPVEHLSSASPHPALKRARPGAPEGRDPGFPGIHFSSCEMWAIRLSSQDN